MRHPPTSLGDEMHGVDRRCIGRERVFSTGLVTDRRSDRYPILPTPKRQTESKLNNGE